MVKAAFRGSVLNMLVAVQSTIPANKKHRKQTWLVPDLSYKIAYKQQKNMACILLLYLYWEDEVVYL